jgi:hypothetical protein
MTNTDQTPLPTANQLMSLHAYWRNSLVRKLICSNDAQFADFAAIFILENFCVYSISVAKIALCSSSPDAVNATGTKKIIGIPSKWKVSSVIYNNITYWALVPYAIY